MTTLVLASVEEINSYKQRANHSVENMAGLFNSCKGVARGAIIEFIANQEGKTCYARRDGESIPDFFKI